MSIEIVGKVLEENLSVSKKTFWWINYGMVLWWIKREIMGNENSTSNLSNLLIF